MSSHYLLHVVSPSACSIIELLSCQQPKQHTSTQPLWACIV